MKIIPDDIGIPHSSFWNQHWAIGFKWYNKHNDNPEMLLTPKILTPTKATQELPEMACTDSRF